MKEYYLYLTKNRKDAIKEYRRGRPERKKIPLPGHRDHAEGTVKL